MLDLPALRAVDCDGKNHNGGQGRRRSSSTARSRSCSGALSSAPMAYGVEGLAVSVGDPARSAPDGCHGLWGAALLKLPMFRRANPVDRPG